MSPVLWACCWASLWAGSSFAADWAAERAISMRAAIGSTGDVPLLGEEALINNGGTAQFTTDDFADMQTLRIGLNGGSGSFEQTAGTWGRRGLHRRQQQSVRPALVVVSSSSVVTVSMSAGVRERWAR